MRALRPIKQTPFSDPRNLMKTSEVPIGKSMRALMFENVSAEDPKFRYGVRLMGPKGKTFIYGSYDELKSLMTDIGQRGGRALDDMAIIGKPTSHLWLGEKAPEYEPQPVDPMKKPLYDNEELPENHVLSPDEVKQFEQYKLAQRIKEQEKADNGGTDPSLITLPEEGSVLTSEQGE